MLCQPIGVEEISARSSVLCAVVSAGRLMVLFCLLFAAPAQCFRSSVLLPLMSLSRLPVVLIQLCMHGLPCIEILRFARCCRMLRSAAADSAFGWAHAPPLPLKSRLLTAKNLLLHVSPMLRRHASFSLEWLEATSVMAGDIDTLLGCSDVVRISELHVRTYHVLAPTQLDRIVTHPSLQQTLRVVSFSAPTAHAVRTLCKLPLLHTLQLDRSLGLPPGGAPDEICSLPPALTSLRVQEQPWLPVKPLILLCHRLLHLSIVTPNLSRPEVLAALFSVPQLASLRSLSLRQVIIPADSDPAVFIRVFQSLAHLERLELSVRGTLAPLLSALSYAVKLHSIDITPTGKCDRMEATLLALLIACPHLQCTVRSHSTVVDLAQMVLRIASHELVQQRITHTKNLN